MTVSILVPYRPDGAERDRNWAWLQDRYRREHPGWELVEADSGGEWNKPAAVNRAARKANGDTLVVADADCFTRPQALESAVAQARHHGWVVPHHRTRRLSPEGTVKVLAGAEPRSAGLDHGKGRVPDRVAAAGGGLLVVRRECFETVGGMDERFAGWGWEDIAFARALDLLCGRHTRGSAVLWHLWHPRQDRERSETNRALWRRYRAAGPAQIREVIAWQTESTP